MIILTYLSLQCIILSYRLFILNNTKELLVNIMKQYHVVTRDTSYGLNHNMIPKKRLTR